MTHNTQEGLPPLSGLAAWLKATAQSGSPDAPTLLIWATELEALRAQAASVEPVAFAKGGSLFWHGNFADHRGESCDLYRAPPVHIPADVEANPYPGGAPREAWQKGFEGRPMLAHAGSDYARFYAEGKAARAPQPQPVAASSPTPLKSFAQLYERNREGIAEQHALIDAENAATSPATAVDAVSGQMLHEHYFLALYPHLDRFRGLDVWGELDQQEKAAWNCAALQASRQPVTQQGVAENAARWQFVMDWGNKDFAVCKRVGVTGTCWEPIKTSGPVDAALATKEQRS